MATLTMVRPMHAKTGRVHLVTDSKYIHDDGTKKFLSGGVDGVVHVWGEDVENDDTELLRVAESVAALAWKGEMLVIGNERNAVQSFTYPDGQPDILITTFMLDVSCIQISNDFSHVLAGSADFNVKWVKVEDNSYKSFKGHQAAILSLALSSNEDFFASTSCDGTAKIWSIPDGQLLQTIPKIHPNTSEIMIGKSMGKVCWSRQDDLILPSFSSVLVFAKQDDSTWKQTRKFTHPDLQDKATFSVVALSPCETYLGASTLEGGLAVWSWVSGRPLVLLAHPNDSNISDLLWHPAFPDQLLFSDFDGGVGALKDISQETGLIELDEEEIEEMVTRPSKAPRILDDDDENSRFSDIGALKAAYDPLLEGLAPDADFPPPSVPTPTPPWRPSSPQPSFVVASSPEHLEHRYMKWNGVGLVKEYRTVEEKSVEVEFHDSAVHHPIFLDNSATQYSMADVSSQALALAAPSIGDRPSNVSMVHFSAQDPASREWSVNLPPGEEVLTLCLGSGWVAVGTSANYVRVLTVGGVERLLWSEADRIVTMVGSGERLAVVSRAGMGVTGVDLQLSIHLCQISLDSRDSSHRMRNPKTLRLPLSPSADETKPTRLRWLGFGNEGSLCAVDSTGVVRQLNEAVNDTWLPILELQTKSPSDTMWPVAVVETPSPIVRCILCKGAQYPPLLPKPTPVPMEWMAPVCSRETDKGKLEAEMMVNELRMGAVERSRGKESAEWQMLKGADLEAIMKLFSLAARAERDTRALEMAKLMPDCDSVNLLITYATNLKRRGLAEKLSDVARSKAEQQRRPVSPLDPAPSSEYDNNEEDMEEEVAIRPPRAVLKSSGNRTAKRPRAPSPAVSDVSLLNGSLPDSSVDDSLDSSLRSEFQNQKNANPFAKRDSKSEEGRDGLSVFDVLDKSKAKKRPETDAKRAKTGQQTKLNFKTPAVKEEPQSAPSSQSAGGKKVSGFSLWLAENRESLMAESEGDDSMAFNKLATARFRALSSQLRKEWMDKAKADATPVDKLSQFSFE